MYILCSRRAFHSVRRKAVICCLLFGSILIGGLVLSASQPLAKLTVATVQSEGIGITQSEASTDALIQAVSMVNGAEIASQMALSVKEIFRETNDSENYSLTEDFQRDIAFRTKGVVKSWRVLDARQDSSLDGLWVVKLEVNVSKHKASKQLKRLRMAIAQFRIGRDASQKENAGQFQRSFTRQLENYLTQSRRFAMLDRGFLAEQSRELAFVSTEGVKIEELARFGNRVGTDYIIVGEVEDARVVSKERTMKTSDKSFLVTTTSGRVSYKIIDVASTQIKFSETVENSVSGDALAKAAHSLAYKAGETIVNAIYPVRVVSGTPEQLTLGQGGKTIQKGEEYNIVRLGKRIIDPYTKESIGREEIIVGKVQIIDVQAKSSTAEIISSHENLLPGIENMSLIIRPLKESKDPVLPRKDVLNEQVKEAVEAGRNAIKVIEQNSGDDW